MNTLRVEWGDNSSELEPNQSYVIGRGEAADVTVDGSQVSRRHLDVAYENGAWQVEDRSSTGTYLDGERIESATITSPMSLRLGPAGSVVVQLTPEVSTPAIEVDDSEVSYFRTVPADDQSLRLDLGDQHSEFQPGSRVVIGRSKQCDMTTANQLVSGKHCAFDHNGDQWVLEDLGSTRGTFIDGRRVAKPTPIEGAFFIGLGDPSAGEPLRVVTAGEHTPPQDKRPLWLAIAAVSIALVAIAGLLLFRPGGSDPNTPEELAAAKLATVYVDTYSADGTWTGSGSGTFVTPEIVLTNRHVAQDAELVFLAVADEEDEPVEYRYQAETLAVHPYLDVMLLRISAGLEIDQGRIMGEGPLPSMNQTAIGIGDSSGIAVGDSVNALGFPALTSGAALSESGELVLSIVTVSEGEVSTYNIWPGCANDQAEAMLVPGGFSACSSDGDLPRANMLTSDLSGSGGSGGPVVVAGKIVAVRYAVRAPGEGSISTSNVALSIPTEYFGDWVASQIGPG